MSSPPNSSRLMPRSRFKESPAERGGCREAALSRNRQARSNAPAPSRTPSAKARRKRGDREPGWTAGPRSAPLRPCALRLSLTIREPAPTATRKTRLPLWERQPLPARPASLAGSALPEVARTIDHVEALAARPEVGSVDPTHALLRITPYHLIPKPARNTSHVPSVL
jgi:hypothetical protein